MSKSEIMKQFAEKTGLNLIDIKLVEHDRGDFVGQDLSLRGAINETIDNMVEARMSREINVGDMVLMEYAKDIVETVKVEKIEDGIVYGTGEDGEDYCAPLDNCDKVPF